MEIPRNTIWSCSTVSWPFRALEICSSEYIEIICSSEIITSHLKRLKRSCSLELRLSISQRNKWKFLTSVRNRYGDDWAQMSRNSFSTNGCNAYSESNGPWWQSQKLGALCRLILKKKVYFSIYCTFSNRHVKSVVHSCFDQEDGLETSWGSFPPRR